MRAPWLPAVSASWDASAAQPGSSPGQAFRGHALDQGLVEGCDDVLKDDVVAGAAVEHVDPATTDQHVIACITSQDVVAGTADQDVVAVAAVGGEQQVSSQSRRFDDIVAGERIDHDSVIGGIEAGDVHLRAQAHNGDPSVVTKDQDDVVTIRCIDDNGVGLTVAATARSGEVDIDLRDISPGEITDGDRIGPAQCVEV